MKMPHQFIFVVSLIITLVLGSLSYLTHKRHARKEFLHLTEFWGALAVNVLLGFMFREGPHVIALSMVGWIWPVLAFAKVLQDVSGANSLLHRWQYIALAAGAFVSVALAGYGFAFFSYTLPFSLAVGVVGFAMVLEAFKKTSKDICSPLHRATYLMMGLFFLQKLTFPLWRLEGEALAWGFFAELVTLIGFAGASLSVYLELMKKRHEGEMNHMVQERNDKLLGQSKYSELGMMSAGIAHEINNPLAVIQARTTQLLRICRDPKRQQEVSEGLEQILFTSERINRTIQGVREFVHQDEQTNVTDIPLKDLVEDVLAFCGQRMKNHGVSLRFYGLEDITVRGNKIQLEQIVLNLFNNSFDAIEYHSDKWIEMSAQREHGRIKIFFKDSGHGIDPQIASRIMEPFFSTKDLGKGTGLGLALAQGIAEKHQGKLSYVSGSTHTTFVLELPDSATDNSLEMGNHWNISYQENQRPLQH